jgi:ActR/RegA family two-component response regulator
VPERPVATNEKNVMNAEDVPDDLESVIRLHVRRVYEKYDHNLTKTAEALQIARNTLKKHLDNRESGNKK